MVGVVELLLRGRRVAPGAAGAYPLLGVEGGAGGVDVAGADGALGVRGVCVASASGVVVRRRAAAGVDGADKDCAGVRSAAAGAAAWVRRALLPPSPSLSLLPLVLPFCRFLSCSCCFRRFPLAPAPALVPAAVL